MIKARVNNVLRDVRDYPHLFAEEILRQKPSEREEYRLALEGILECLASFKQE